MSREILKKCIRQQEVEHSCFLPVIASVSTSRWALLKQKETLLCVIANGVYGVKQSPRAVGDCHVAKSSPRSDIVLSFLVGME